MPKKLKVTAVSYLNTKPFLYGILSSGLGQKLDLQIDIPSDCAKKLERGEVELGLVPVAVIPQLTTPHIISDYCIGAVGSVQTVCIFSECPIEEVESIYLDYHSRTSVELAKILLRDYWHLSPTMLPTAAGYESQIGGKTAGLVIGDRAIDLLDQFPYVYDLGEVWEKHTGLPFVFAAWISNQPLPAEFIKEFNEALAIGLAHIPQLKLLLPNPHPNFDLEHYFTHSISYDLDDAKRKALKTFLQAMNKEIQPSLALS